MHLDLVPQFQLERVRLHPKVAHQGLAPADSQQRNNEGRLLLQPIVLYQALLDQVRRVNKIVNVHQALFILPQKVAFPLH